MRAENQFPKTSSPLKTGTGELPPSLTDVSLRQGRGIRVQPVPTDSQPVPEKGTACEVRRVR